MMLPGLLATSMLCAMVGRLASRTDRRASPTGEAPRSWRIARGLTRARQHGAKLLAPRRPALARMCDGVCAHTDTHPAPKGLALRRMVRYVPKLEDCPIGPTAPVAAAGSSQLVDGPCAPGGERRRGGKHSGGPSCPRRHWRAQHHTVPRTPHDVWGGGVARRLAGHTQPAAHCRLGARRV